MKQFIAFALVACMFTFSYLTVAPRAVLAGCVCEYNDATTADTKDGIYRQTLDGTDRSCQALYQVAGLAPDAAQTTEAAFKCDPFNATIDPGFRVPTFAELIGNVIRLFFFVAGLVALVFLLLGGFEWVSSGGDSKKTDAARAKITSAVIGLVIMIAVLSLVIFLEQVVFGGKICLGISCPMNIGFMQLIR